MKDLANLKIAAVLAALLVVGAVQGNRVDRIRDAELFYRWILNASTQWRLEGTLIYDDSQGGETPLDDELFSEVLAEAEATLPEPPADLEEDQDEEGNNRPKLIRAALHEMDDAIWKFASSAAAKPERDEFLKHLSDGRLQSVGTQLSTATLYENENVYGAGVSSLFFGFRKVAANFLWLQVDKYWHAGQMHRMVPLMRTCVTLDPNFIDAYLLGAWHLAYNITANMPDTPEPQKEFNPKYGKRLGPKETWYHIAMDFLRDGIKKNPRDYRLYFDLGYGIYENKLRDHANAVLFLTEATRQRHDKWVPRMLYGSQMRNGQYEDAIAGWQDYLERVDPSSEQAPRFIRINEGYIAESVSEDARQCARAAEAFAETHRAQAEEARAAGDTQKAAQLTALADQAEADAEEFEILHEEKHEEALAIWTELDEVADEPIAYARILRMKALDLAAEERYQEAVWTLNLARWESNAVFDELSWMIIEIKQDHPDETPDLTVSERLAIERRREAEQFNPKLKERRENKKRRVECEAYMQAVEENELAPAPPA